MSEKNLFYENEDEQSPEYERYGDLKEWVIEKLRNEGKLEGEEAAAYLADCFADETHGNYKGRTLYLRADVCEYYEITITKKK